MEGKRRTKTEKNQESPEMPEAGYDAGWAPSVVAANTRKESDKHKRFISPETSSGNQATGNFSDAAFLIWTLVCEQHPEDKWGQLLAVWGPRPPAARRRASGPDSRKQGHKFHPVYLSSPSASGFAKNPLGRVMATHLPSLSKPLKIFKT